MLFRSYMANLRIAQLLYAGFAVLLLVTLFRGISADCGCFGSISGRVSWLHVLGDMILYFFTTLLVIWQQIVQNFEPAEMPPADSVQQEKE